MSSALISGRQLLRIDDEDRTAVEEKERERGSGLTVCLSVINQSDVVYVLGKRLTEERERDE